jgi:hypothetical protein
MVTTILLGTRGFRPIAQPHVGTDAFVASKQSKCIGPQRPIAHVHNSFFDLASDNARVRQANPNKVP